MSCEPNFGSKDNAHYSFHCSTLTQLLTYSVSITWRFNHANTKAYHWAQFWGFCKFCNIGEEGLLP